MARRGFPRAAPSRPTDPAREGQTEDQWLIPLPIALSRPAAPDASFSGTL